jgi:hypothetical protein
MTAMVLSELKRISSIGRNQYNTRIRKIKKKKNLLDPRSPSANIHRTNKHRSPEPIVTKFLPGPPVCTLVMSFSRRPSCLYNPRTYCLTDIDVIPYLSCGIPPNISALFPVVNDFHHVSAPRERACTAHKVYNRRVHVVLATYALPSPSYPPYPLLIEKGRCLAKSLEILGGEITIRSKE